MKKFLLLLSFLTTSLTINSQIISFDNNSTLTVGNIGTDLTGMTLGQDGYKTFVSSTATPAASNSDFQIVDKGGVYGNSIQVTGASASTGTRVLNKTNLQALWATRIVGNDIIEVELEIFTGPATTSRNGFRLILYTNEATPKPIAGIGLAKNATFTTGLAPNQVQTNYTNVITGYGYATNNNQTTLYGYSLGGSAATPQLQTTDDTWIKIGFSYDKFTGQTKWKGPGLNAFNATTTTASAIGFTPGRLDIIGTIGNLLAVTNGATPPVTVFPAINNALAASAAFDNILIRASSTDTLLSVESIQTDSNIFSLSPNPANDIIKISNAEKINVNQIFITDINGRIVKNVNFNNVSNIELNVAELKNGLYFLNINSDKGIITKKIMKN